MGDIIKIAVLEEYLVEKEGFDKEEVLPLIKQLGEFLPSTCYMNIWRTPEVTKSVSGDVKAHSGSLHIRVFITESNHTREEAIEAFNELRQVLPNVIRAEFKEELEMNWEYTLHFTLRV